VELPDRSHALGPSSELIALGVVGLLASIAVIALTKATDEEQAETRRRSREQFGSLTELREELSGTVERLHEEVLDERVLQFLLHDKTDPDAWGKWEVLVDESRAEREVYDVGVGASG
jgi:type II secretory pathway pseudopilin PulG